MNWLVALALLAGTQEKPKEARPAAPQTAPKPPPSRDEVLKQDIENAIKRLGSDKFTESYVAKEELVELGRRAVPAVVAELKKEKVTPPVKRALCEILGQVRDPNPEAVAILTAKLKDTDEHGTSIAAAAAHALGAIADDGSIPALLETLKSRAVETDKLLKYECIRALGILRAKEAVEPLKKALEDKKLASAGGEDDGARPIAAAAADALGLIRAQDAVEDLAKLLSDEATKDPTTDEKLNVIAARALQRILEHELRGKVAKDELRAGSLLGAPAEVTATIIAWKLWADEREGGKKVAETKERLAKIAAAVETYKKDQGKLPAILDYIKLHPEATKPLPKDGYYQGELRDAWNDTFKYALPGTGSDFDLYSLGKDRKQGGVGLNADLWNHDKWIAAKKAETKKRMDEILAALSKFKEDQGTYPTVLDGLVKALPGLTLPKPFPPKGYLASLPKDGFDQFFDYKVPGTEGEPFDLISHGADGTEGGENENEDLWNHAKRPPKKDDKK